MVDIYYAIRESVSPETITNVRLRMQIGTVMPHTLPLHALIRRIVAISFQYRSRQVTRSAITIPLIF